jgi:hypothetical protein
MMHLVGQTSKHIPQRRQRILKLCSSTAPGGLIISLTALMGFTDRILKIVRRIAPPAKNLKKSLLVRFKNIPQ